MHAMHMMHVMHATHLIRLASGRGAGDEVGSDPSPGKCVRERHHHRLLPQVNLKSCVPFRTRCGLPVVYFILPVEAG